MLELVPEAVCLGVVVLGMVLQTVCLGVVGMVLAQPRKNRG